METQTTVKTVVVHQAERPEGFQRSFVGVMAEQGIEALRAWMKDAKAPVEVIETVDGIEGLITVLESPGELVGENRVEAELTGDSIAKISRGMHFAGVSMESGGSIVYI